MSNQECKLCKGSCEFCGGSIQALTGKPGRPRLYCCQHCRETRYNYREARPERSPAICKVCNAEIPVLTHGRPPKYCSDDCRKEIRRRQAAEMEQYYKTITRNKEAVQRMFGGTYADYMRRFDGKRSQKEIIVSRESLTNPK